jgi:ferrous iron transport protein B
MDNTGNEPLTNNALPKNGKIFTNQEYTNSPKKFKTITAALVGSPNCGKTTIFNNLTGARQHVGNYPGVTVEQKTGHVFFKDYDISIIDLPGTYSLTAFSAEEAVTRKHLIYSRPDVVINVVDASNLERNLYLTSQLIELGCNLIVVFNMSDILNKSGTLINYGILSELLGASIINTVGSKNTGTADILSKVVETFESTKSVKTVKINYGEEIEHEISRMSDFLSHILASSAGFTGKYDKRWISIKFLEQDKEISDEIGLLLDKECRTRLSDFVKKMIRHVTGIFAALPATVIAQSRYGFINGALKEATIKKNEIVLSFSDKLDRVLLNRFFGLPIFGLIMWIVFQLAFKVGDYPTRWLGLGFEKLAILLSGIMPEGLLRSLVVDGIIGGVGGVLVFTPKIAILFIGISILEDTGYMARAAFVMDRIMHRIGLHGKSFIPMLIGFGCTIPAYMCTRTLEDKNDRMITMHINTFMSCGGRLPVYILFAGVFFPKNAGSIIFSIYIIGIIMAVLFAKVLRATRFKGEAEPFVMELPVYRLPTAKGVLFHMWDRTWQYIKKAGTVIVAISIIMWILFTFPRISLAQQADTGSRITAVTQSYNRGGISSQQYEIRLSEIQADAGLAKLKYSAAGRIGKFIEPVFKPLGFDWKLALASIAGLAGKEVVVSTLGTIYSISGNEKNSAQLKDAVKKDYNPLVGYSFMLFSLLYFPCIASLAVFKREAGSKEMFFQIGFTLLLAWSVSFIVFQVGRIFI